MFSKAEEAEKVINKLIKLNNIQAIGIEQNLQSFRSGFSSAQTISTLSKFNGIVSFISFEIFKTEPVHINVNAARKSLGIKLIRKKDGGKPTKDQVLEWVQSNVEFSWPKKILKSGPRKGQEVNDPGCFDIADAYEYHDMVAIHPTTGSMFAMTSVDKLVKAPLNLASRKLFETGQADGPKD